MQRETLSLLQREKLNPNSLRFRIRTFVMKDQNVPYLRFAGKKGKPQRGAYRREEVWGQNKSKSLESMG